MKPPSGAAFLLSHIGAQVSKRFAERLAVLDLTPAHVGVLRVVGQNPGLDQRELARRLGVVPSRVVALVDQLEDRGILQRERSTTDRRQYQLFIPDTARDQRRAIMKAVSDHDADVTGPLTQDEIATLVRLLTKLAATQAPLPEGHQEADGR